jgi:hypothetical protein
MIQVVYQGEDPARPGRQKKHYRTPDGREWREPATGQELADLPPGALVIIGNGQPKPKHSYDGLLIAGAPFLPAIACLVPVYIEGEA